MNLHPEEAVTLEFDAVERWTVMHCPLFDRIFLYVLAASFGLDAGNEEFALLPTRGVQLQVNNRIVEMLSAGMLYNNVYYGMNCSFTMFDFIFSV